MEKPQADVATSRMLSSLLGRKVCLLIAEDDEILREQAVDHLRRQGYDVLAAQSGEAAVKSARGMLPDGIIMDCKLDKQGGRIDGVDALVQIGKLSPDRQVPTAVRSRYLSDGTYQEKARKCAAQVDRWYDQTSTPDDLVGFVVHYVEQPMLIELLVDRLDEYREFIGALTQLEKIASHDGVVEHVDLPTDDDQLGEAHVVFGAAEETFARVFPATRLLAAGACFLNAKLRYTIYSLREKNISVIEYIGPPKEEVLRAPLTVPSDEDIRELE